MNRFRQSGFAAAVLLLDVSAAAAHRNSDAVLDLERENAQRSLGD